MWRLHLINQTYLALNHRDVNSIRFDSGKNNWSAVINPRGGGEGFSAKFRVGVCRPQSQNGTVG